MIVLPEQKLGVVVMANSATAGPVVNKVATEALKLAFETKTGIKQPEQAKAAAGKGTLSREAMKDFEGRYATIPGVVNVTGKSDRLRADVMATSFRLVPRADGLLGLKYKLLGIIPISLGELDRIGFSRARVAGHEIVKATINGQEQLVGELINPVPIPEVWQNLVGEYELVNAGDDAVLIDKVRVQQDNGLLLVEYTMPLFSDKRMSLAIMPLSDSEALISGLGRGMGETIRIVNVGGEEMFQYSGYLFRKKQE
jgi:hypothetical protein